MLTRSKLDPGLLEDALDTLVVYSLIKPKAEKGEKAETASTSNEDRTYALHPLVQLWAQETIFDGRSVELVKDRAQREKLHKGGELMAFTLVGCGLKNTNSGYRTSADWIFERRNMAHINLCLERYLETCKQEVFARRLLDAAVARALYRFSRFHYYWGNNTAWGETLKLSITVYEMALKETNSTRLEEELLNAKQMLIMYWRYDAFPADVEVESMFDEVLKRQTAILKPESLVLLHTYILKADYLHVTHRLNEALEKYKMCMEKLETAEGIGEDHTLYMMIVGSLALVYGKLGQLEQAATFFERSVDLHEKYHGLNHINTCIVLENMARFKAERGAAVAASEYQERAVRGMEAIYGPANKNTLSPLNHLAKMYRDAGRYEKAEETEKKLKEARRMLSVVEETVDDV